MTAGDRRLAGLAIGVLAAAAALGLAPADASPRTELRSEIVYPPQRIAIRMDHAHPAHVGLRCERCHEGATDSTRASDLLIPAEARCNPCHADRTDRAQASEATCGYCHVGYGGENGADVPASSFPAPRLHFSHALHAGEGIRCVECHRGISRASVATRAHLPDMRTCLGCHRRSAEADDACTTCHLAGPDGRLRTRFGERVMNPPRWLGGMHHDRDFLVRHRWVAADRATDCVACHTEDECTACHDGRIRPLSVHPGDFLTTHPQMARRDEPRCQSCHNPTQFCAECHSRLGFGPASAPATRFEGRYHPPAPVWVTGPSLHGREARRSMTTCASCHAEEDCVACHGAVGVGAGLSPHPPGFRNDCSRFWRQNPRACETCHAAGDAALAVCR